MPETSQQPPAAVPAAVPAQSVPVKAGTPTATNEEDRLARLENSIAALLQEVTALRQEKTLLMVNQK